MAEAMLNKLAAGRVRAFSAGTKPAKETDPTVVEAMRESGIEIGHHTPKRLTIEMIRQADRVITMGCGVEGMCPGIFVETEDWSIDDPGEKPLGKVREIREQIQAKVVELLENIS